MQANTIRIKELQSTLESLVDGNTLELVLDQLQTICFEKAEHLDANWQDRNAAQSWEKAGEKLARAIAFASDRQI